MDRSFLFVFVMKWKIGSYLRIMMMAWWKENKYDVS